MYPADDFRTFAEFARSQYAAYHPNYITAYSNFAVALLGAVIERVTGQKYEDYVHNNILEPCGMAECGFDPKKNSASLLAMPYRPDGNPFPYLYFNANPAGFLAANSSSMAKFMQMILNGGRYHGNRILYPHTLYRMFKPQNIFLPMKLWDPYFSNNFGLSWFLYNKSYKHLGRVVGHDGGLTAYFSDMLLATDKKIGVFATSNTYFNPADIASFALEEAGKIFRKVQTPDVPELPPVVAIPDHIKNFYTGTYCISGYPAIEVYVENDTLFWQPGPERTWLVFHADDWASFINTDDTTLAEGIRVAIRNMHGKKVVLTEYRNQHIINRVIAGSAYTPFETIPENIQQMIGLYREPSETFPVFQLAVGTLQHSDKQFLALNQLANGSHSLLSISDDNALIIEGLGRSVQETIGTNGDTLTYSGLTFVAVTDEQKENKEIIPIPSDGTAQLNIADGSPVQGIQDFIIGLKKLSQR